MIFSIVFAFISRKIFVFILVSFLVFGGIYFKSSLREFSPDGGDVSVLGVICEEVDKRRSSIKITVCTEETYGKILVTLPKYPNYEYGDKVQLKGNLQAPENFEDFSYQNYLARYDIYSVMYFPEISVISKNHGSLFFHFLFKVKVFFESRIEIIFPEPHSSLLAGLILGSRRGIPEDLMEKFNAVGLTHIIAISGYNVTIVIAAISGLFRFLRRKLRIIFSVLAILIFVFLVGCSASVVRAAIMGILALFAVWVGRKSEVGISLLFAAFLMTLFNPKILVYDISFQLSFAATIGLIYISPFLERVFKKVPSFFAVKESLVMTLSAQAATIPLILLYFGRFSLIAPLANVLVLPLVPFAMFLGFAAVLLDTVFLKFLSLIVGYVGWGVLEVIISIVEVLFVVV